MSRHFGGRPVGQSEKAKVVLALFFLVLMVVAGVAVWFLGKSTPQPKAPEVVVQIEQEQKMLDVLVPLREIQTGVALQPAMFKKEKRAANSVDKRVVKDFEDIAGFYSRTLLVANQPLHMDYITNVKPTTAISSTIPTGFRAVTIRVNATTGVEGWAQPGAKVDILWTSEIAGKSGITTIVQNAKVLSAERQVSANNSQPQPGQPVPSTITLLVTATDARKITLAASTGTLSLSLRGDMDVGKPDSADGSITVDDLLGRKAERSGLPASKGTVTIGGEKWIVDEGGNLVPFTKRSVKGADQQQE